MKKIVLLTVLAGASGLCAAQEMGRVISSTPVVSQVGVPRQVCSTEAVPVQSQKSGAGAIMGGLAGGAIGNAIGGGGGRAAATVLGIFGGAILGDRIEGPGQTQMQTVQNCTSQTFYENRTTSFNVVYEYAGKQYSVQMPNDPGPFVRLQITPVGATQPQASLPASTTFIQPEPVRSMQSGQPVVIQQVVPQPVYVAVEPAVYPTVYPTVYPAAYPVYYGRPYYPPIGVNLNLGWSNGYFGDGRGHGRGHGHWR